MLAGGKPAGDPVIHYLHVLILEGAFPSCNLFGDWEYSGQVTILLKVLTHGSRSLSLTFTLVGSVESPVDLTFMSLNCGRKAEGPEESHTGGGGGAQR